MNKKGFTLIELMVVILIIAILAAVVIPIMRDKAEQINAEVAEDIEKRKARQVYTQVARSIANRKAIDKKVYGKQPKAVEPVIIERIITKKYDWKRSFNGKPAVYQLVLIKLDNNIITTGRFTNKNEWKIEADKMKYNGGRSVKVASWKEIDID